MGKKCDEGTKKCKVIIPADTSNGQLSLMKFFTLNDEMFNTLMNEKVFYIKSDLIIYRERMH